MNRRKINFKEDLKFLALILIGCSAFLLLLIAYFWAVGKVFYI